MHSSTTESSRRQELLEKFERARFLAFELHHNLQELADPCLAEQHPEFAAAVEERARKLRDELGSALRPPLRLVGTE